MICPTRIVSASPGDRGAVRLQADTGWYELAAFSDRVIHVAYHPAVDAAEPPMIGLLPRDAAAPSIRITTTETGWRLDAGGAAVTVDAASAELGFLDAAGREVTRLRSVRMTPVDVGGERTRHGYAAFATRPGEAFYGLGQHQTDWMDHAKWDVKLWHDYQAPGGEIIGVPFLVTNQHYGLIWDNPSRSLCWPANGGNNLWWAEVCDAISFFVLTGDTADDLYACYRQLTGVTPMPPRSALGYIQCKQRYQNQAELLEVAREYRRRGYPCDMLVVDWFHWKQLGDMDLDAEHWPDPSGMNRELADMGYRVMISCWPRFTPGSRHFDRLKQAGWFMRDAEDQPLVGTPLDDRGALLDLTHPDAARWFWDEIQSSYGGRGFSSWWLDENEPDICPHPYRLHVGSGARYHNVYPLASTEAVYQGHRRDRDDRCLTLSRSAWLGAQRTGATFWSSDIHPSWDVFRRQIPAGLNFCATGFAWWSSDIGGWHALPGQFDDAEDIHSLLISTGPTGEPQRLDYPELYVRWFQFGAFCPTFRAHGTRPANEVWSFGDEAEAILVRYLQLRYRLMPYLYSLAWRTHQTGAPFMRALFMDFPDDPEVRDMKYQYMFGPALLVAPVFEPDVTRWPVYLPAGCDWYDYWSGERYEGGQRLEVDAPLHRLPLFARAGGIIPHGEVIEHTGQPQRDLSVHVYPGRDGTFDLYHDDGISYAYEQGDYTVTRLRWDDSAASLAIEGDEAGLFPGDANQHVVRP